MDYCLVRGNRQELKEKHMVTLNDYLYSGDTIFRILQKYARDLSQSAEEKNNVIDQVHSHFLMQIMDLLQHNEFLTGQSQQIRDFYKFLANEFPYLAFTFRGRIKSLIRAEEKFNGYIVEYIYKYYTKYGKYPNTEELAAKLGCFRDLIAYRIVISMPKCHLQSGQSKQEIEKEYLYRIANMMPSFLEKRGFVPESAGVEEEKDAQLNPDLSFYYRDYVKNPTPIGYQSLHITLYDKTAKCYIEVQLRTKEMDDYAEIGPANHMGYEKRQEHDRSKRESIPEGECVYFDEAFRRLQLLQKLDLAEVDVNMFAAMNNALINDGCGLFRGRLILPFEHLSRFQTDIID